jgi:hypothetical protein
VKQTTKHPDYKERKEWLGRKFDPEACDLDAINKKLNPRGK